MRNKMTPDDLEQCFRNDCKLLL